MAFRSCIPCHKGREDACALSAGSFFLISTLIMIGISASLLYLILEQINLTEDLSLDMLYSQDVYLTIVLASFFILLIINIFWFFQSFILIIGARNDHAAHITQWLCGSALWLIFEPVFGILGLAIDVSGFGYILTPYFEAYYAEGVTAEEKMALLGTTYPRVVILIIFICILIIKFFVGLWTFFAMLGYRDILGEVREMKRSYNVVPGPVSNNNTKGVANHAYEAANGDAYIHVDVPSGTYVQASRTGPPGPTSQYTPYIEENVPVPTYVTKANPYQR